MSIRSIAIILVWLLASLLGLGGCTTVPAPATATTDTAFRVVTTVAPLTNIVYNVSGDAVDLVGLVPPGVNSHTFEPSPSDAQVLATADLILLNGLQLEVPVMDMVEANVGPEVRVVSLGDRVLDRSEWVFDFSFPASGGAPNPHLWMNPQITAQYVEVIRDELVAAVPAQAATFQANADAYLARLAELDAATATAIATIPVAQRKLLTYHDSWAYFAPRYGLTLVGALQPSHMAEPSVREVAALVQQVRTENVTVLFGASEFPTPVLEAIARETGVTFNDSLADDVLPGTAGTPEHTYIGMMLHNVRIITEALGGDAAALDTVSPANVPQQP